MNKQLILTGWSKNSYLAGAAAALAALNGKADIAGVSMDALADMLVERGPDYSAIFRRYECVTPILHETQAFLIAKRLSVRIKQASSAYFR